MVGFHQMSLRGLMDTHRSKIRAKEVLTRALNKDGMEIELKTEEEELSKCIEKTIAVLGQMGVPLRMRLDLTSHNVIARELGLTEATVKTRISRAREKLREKCKEYY